MPQGGIDICAARRNEVKQRFRKAEVGSAGPNLFDNLLSTTRSTPLLVRHDIKHLNCAMMYPLPRVSRSALRSEKRKCRHDLNVMVESSGVGTAKKRTPSERMSLPRLLEARRQNQPLNFMDPSLPYRQTLMFQPESRPLAIGLSKFSRVTDDNLGRLTGTG